ncbi:MAG: CshA/CshB family fibrillar adhesin-related protein [Angelakisella sp.]
MISAKFAEPGSAGALATQIGWIDFGPGFTLYPDPDLPPVHVSNALPGGYTVEFDITLSATSGFPTEFNAIYPPAYERTSFGSTGYTGINGNVALYSIHTFTPSVDETIHLSNIVVTNSKGQQTTTYQFVAADGETTDGIETLSFYTNNSFWSLLDNLPATNGPATSPIISGVGTPTVLETGIDISPWTVSGPVFITNAPTGVSATLTFSDRTQQGVAFGIIITDRQQALSDLIESVALESTALSHILNAEGEKIQAIVASGTMDEMLAVNKSVQGMASAVTTLEMVLQGKLALFNGCICPDNQLSGV